MISRPLKIKPMTLFLKILLCFLLMPSATFASLNKNLWPKWEVSNPLSKSVISHQEWQTFLNKHVITNDEGINLVDYPHLTEADQALLKRYISRMSQINIRDYNRNEQLAFWLNLYNALAIETVARYYPVDNIHEVNITPGIFNAGPWGASLTTIQGSRLSLDEIQNNIIRAIWNDPRIHYALNNASIGAANLSKQAFQGSTIDAQLNKAAYEYINSLRGIQVIEDKLIASKVYKWFASDFGDNDEDLIFHLSQYADEPLRTKLKHIHTINSFVYNWHLNSTVASSS